MTGWLTTTQAGKAMGICRKTVYRWVCDGVIPKWAQLQVGNRTRISAEWCAGKARP